jgi:hypothetical protein
MGDAIAGFTAGLFYAPPIPLSLPSSQRCQPFLTLVEKMLEPTADMATSSQLTYHPNVICALVAEGLAAALTNAAVRLSATLQVELQRAEWQQRTGREGLEHALSLLRAHMGPLVNGQDCQGYREVLRCAWALAQAVNGLHAT